MNTYQAIILSAFIVMSAASFFCMGLDKRLAANRRRRISERTLFALAILFGGVGGTVGMYAFRHKTKHWYFAVFFPLLALLDIAALVLGMYYLM